jgi:hypothetical protein
MNDHRRRILDMLAAGKITADEAEQLLNALPESEAKADAAPSVPPQYLRIEVRKPARDGQRERKVNLRVPVAVVKSGLKLGSLMRGFKDDRWGRWSDHLRARGLDVDFDQLDATSLEALLNHAGDVTIDVDDGRAQIRVVRE